jgi:branched-chain amino acid aminotransferase
MCGLQSGQLTPIDLIVEEHFHRAAPGGMGGTKAAGNYSPVLVTQLEAKRKNYAGVLREKSCVSSTESS